PTRRSSDLVSDPQISGVNQVVWLRLTPLVITGFIDTAIGSSNHRHMIGCAAGRVRRKEIITQAELLSIAPVNRNIFLGILIDTGRFKFVHFSAVDSRRRSS